MAITMSGEGGDDKPVSEINTTPLVDVMLVLLIIFLIAVPVVIQTVNLQVPVLPFEPTESKKSNVLLSITTTDAQGRDPAREESEYSGATRGGACRIYWGVQPVDSNELITKGVKHLEDQIESFGGVENMLPEDVPEVHIRADVNTPYKCVGGAVYQMQRAGYVKVGFISNPVAPEL